MPADPAMVAALEQALAVDPAAHAVRLHLATILVDGGEPDRALAHCDVLLTERPHDTAVLALAARAADLAGQPGLAASFRRVAALASEPPATSDAPSTALPPPTGPPLTDGAALPPPGDPDGPFGDEIDQFLRDVLRRDRATRVRLADVAGLADVKARLEQSFLGPIRNPELRLAYGMDVRGGLLLWGPPGCGKTYLAKAVAGELGASFLPVGVHDVLDMWVGNSERNLHAFFEAARRARPSVLFFDELDALGFSRSKQRTSSAMRSVVAQLLDELDGVRSDNDGIFVLGATNQPWDVDPALRRPGRFDRTVLVLPPDVSARAAILARALQDRPTEGVDVDRIAAATDGCTGADLRLVASTAVELAFADAQRTGNLQPIGQRHLEAAARTVRPSAGAWLDAARNFVTYANESGDYDELAAYLKRRPRR